MKQFAIRITLRLVLSDDCIVARMPIAFDRGLLYVA